LRGSRRKKRKRATDGVNRKIKAGVNIACSVAFAAPLLGQMMCAYIGVIQGADELTEPKTGQQRCGIFANRGGKWRVCRR
jgi:hypothetical protein